MRTKQRFTLLLKPRQRPRPLQKTPEEREFVIDSCASMHMLSKKVLSSDEMETLRRSSTPTVVVTANVKRKQNKEAQVCVHDLGLFVTVQLFEDTPAGVSLEKLCEKHGYSNEWVTRQQPRLTNNGKKITCNTDNFVPSCCSRVIVQYWHEFVFNIVIAELVINKSSHRSKRRTRTRKLGPKENKNK